MSNTLITTIESSLPFLSETESRLAHYILEHKSEVLSMPVKELAEKSLVSEATITRFARSMGTKGFADFKLILSAALVPAQDKFSLEKIKESDSPMEIYHKVAQFAIQSIRDTEELMDNQTLGNAAELIYKTAKSGNRIYAVGSGASGTLVEQFQLKMMRLDIPVIYYKDSHLQLESLLNIKSKDLLIAFTILGRSKETRQYINIAKEKKAKVIICTQHGNKDLTEQADVILNTANIENQHRLISSTALITSSTVIDAIFFSLAVKNYGQIRKDVESTREEFKELGWNY